MITKAPQRPVAVTPEIEHAIQNNAVVSISVSGGKDSFAVALATCAELDRRHHTGPRLLIHADLGRIEWKDSLPACQRLADYLDLPLIVTKRAAGDMIDRWETRWTNSRIRYAALNTVKLILPWSTPKLRFCTSEMKTKIIAAKLRSMYPGQQILNVLGIRAEESTSRSLKPVSVVSTELLTKNQINYTWNPIKFWTLKDVWDEINTHNVRAHEAYLDYGSSRVSCAYCILGSQSDLIASSHCRPNQTVYRTLVDLEIRSTFGFQSARWLADINPKLLTTETRKRVRNAKQNAAIREHLEASIPKHMLYVKGWPTTLPTRAEAQLLSNVRNGICDIIELSSQYLTAGDIRNRYQELLNEKASGK